MILHDLRSGGFPVSRRAPIICVSNKGEISVVYNRYDLNNTKKLIEIKYCMGVQPGRKNTDCFILDPESYTKITPPEEFRDIDSAENIEVQKSFENKLKQINYTPGPHSDDKTPIISKDQKLYDYIKFAGLKCKESYIQNWSG